MDIVLVAAGLVKLLQFSHGSFVEVEKVGIGFDERISGYLFLHKDGFTDSRVVDQGPCLIQYISML